MRRRVLWWGGAGRSRGCNCVKTQKRTYKYSDPKKILSKDIEQVLRSFESSEFDKAHSHSTRHAATQFSVYSYEAGSAKIFPRGGPRANTRSASPTEGVRPNFRHSSSENPREKRFQPFRARRSRRARHVGAPCLMSMHLMSGHRHNFFYCASVSHHSPPFIYLLDALSPNLCSICRESLWLGCYGVTAGHLLSENLGVY